MEVYFFNIDGLEQKLDEVRCALALLYLSVYGLYNLDLIEKQECSSLIHFITQAIDTMEKIIRSMEPVEGNLN